MQSPQTQQCNNKKLKAIKIILKQSLTEINQLKAKGVSGRIWGQSQKLSKLKNFTDVQPYEHIPDIKKVEETAKFKQVIEVGNSHLLTCKFDISKTSKLKNLLNRHISKGLSIIK